MTRFRLRVRDDESGVALLIALGFLSLFGVFIASVLSFADTTFRVSVVLRDQASNIYTSDGAVDGAINYIRSDIEAGRDPAIGGSCPSAGVLPNFTANGVTATVTCVGQPNSGVGSGANPLNTPTHSILSLSTAAPLTEHGIEQVSPLAVSVEGSIFSNSDIVNSGGVMAVQGDVSALGDCTLVTIVSTAPPLNCANQPGGPGNPLLGVDPDYAPVTLTVPVHRDVPVCAGPNKIVEFQPGYYDDVAGLNALMDGTCPASIFWFKPGTSGVGAYYFDFHSATAAHVWTISDATTKVVGGTKKGWIEGIPVPVVTIPGACRTESDGAPNDGVQFIFGGDSRINITAGKLELCPQPSSIEQEIAIYGLKAGAEVPTTATLRPTAHDAATLVGFSNPSNAYVLDGLPAPAYANAALGPATPVGSIELKDLTPAIAAGSNITGASLRLGHQEDLTLIPLNTPVITLTITPGTGAPITKTITPSPVYTALPAIDLLAEGMSNLTSALNGLTVTYTVITKAGTSVNANLDGVTLDLTYAPPAFEAESGCTTLIGYPGVGTCAVFAGSGVATIALQGTVYAPRAPLDIQIPGTSVSPLNRGVICRVARFGVTGVAVSAIPDPGPRTDREVLFTVKIGGVTKLRGIAVFADGGGLTPGTSVGITSWSVVR